jgi:hypothetical protein
MQSRTATLPRAESAEQPLELTLLELVHAVSEVTASDAETVATVRYLLASGRVRLCGNFRGVPIRQLC